MSNSDPIVRRNRVPLTELQIHSAMALAAWVGNGVNNIGALEPGVPHSTRHVVQSPRQMQAIERPKINRNDPCFCGSGRKFKRCCLKPVRKDGEQ